MRKKCGEGVCRQNSLAERVWVSVVVVADAVEGLFGDA